MVMSGVVASSGRVALCSTIRDDLIPRPDFKSQATTAKYRVLRACFNDCLASPLEVHS